MVTQFEGAKVTVQGTTFGIVIVKSHVLHNSQEQAGARLLGIKAFGQIPIVLMTQDSRGVPTYQGRRDIVRFLTNVFLEQIPWQRYTLSPA
jgi:glutaredoxin 2